MLAQSHGVAAPSRHTMHVSQLPHHTPCDWAAAARRREPRATPAPVTDPGYSGGVSEQTLAERIDALRAQSPVAAPQHPDVAQWRAPTDADIDGIHAVAAAADAVDHPTWITPREDIADTFDLEHIDHSRDSLVALDADGTIIAYGSAVLHPSRGGELMVYLEGAVHPQHRRRGIGATLLRWQRARAIEKLAAEVPTLQPREDGEWIADIKVYAEDVNADHQKVAQAAGFSPERWFTSMLRDMSESLPTVTAVEGITVVEYSHDRDEDARLARNDAFRDHWGSLPSQPETWAKFVGGPFFRADLSRLAVDADGEIVGFSLASVNEDDWEALGATNSYIDLIGVVRAHRRRGIAPLVIAGTLEAIAAAGLEKAVLDVDTASPTGANTLYDGLGFRATERSVALVLHV